VNAATAVFIAGGVLPAGHVLSARRIANPTPTRILPRAGCRSGSGLNWREALGDGGCSYAAIVILGITTVACTIGPLPPRENHDAASEMGGAGGNNTSPVPMLPLALEPARASPRWHDEKLGRDRQHPSAAAWVALPAAVVLDGQSRRRGHDQLD